MTVFNVTLPYPPSSNKIWRKSTQGRLYLIKEVREFRTKVMSEVYGKCTFGESKLNMEIKLYPPDKRKRDIDNPIKSILDALQCAKVYQDDAQIYKLKIEKMLTIVEGGKVELTITEIV